MSHNKNTEWPEQSWTEQHELLFGFLIAGGTLLTIAIMLFCIYWVPELRLRRYRKKTYGVTHAEWNALSHPSHDLMVRYFALPADSRPWPNLYRTLLHIDTKYGGSEEVNRTRWAGHPEYKELEQQMVEIKENLRLRNIAISASTVPDVDHEVELLTARLRAEAGIIENVTKEIQ